MLTELRIRNFAIIEQVNLPLGEGFNVLSGETGAGKSIIVGALGLLLGERASADLIRSGAEKATVEGVFDVSRVKGIAALADERGIEVEEETLVLKREISTNGRGRAWINGATVTTTILAEIGRQLVNLHGQHDAQTLLDQESQRGILDAFGGADAQASLVRASHAELSAIRREIAALSQRRTDAEKRADYLRHVAKEIEDSRLTPGEDVRLEDEARVLENADELRTLATSLGELLAGEEGSVLSQLGAAQRPLTSIERIDSSAARMQELFDTAFYALQELARSVEDYAGSVDLDPARLDEVRQRRDRLFGLLKKYGPTLDAVIETGKAARVELDLVDTAGLDIANLSARESDVRRRLGVEAEKLTEMRLSAAKKLAKAVDVLLPSLGMPDGRFTVSLTSRDEPTSEGAEDVEFRVALNVGHEDRPLARVASGGELSRVMLALKTILARVDRVPTLIFDEVDAGIGGRVGLQVGDTLRRVAKEHQVFAISHLPQIAARAHHHIVVAKGAKGGVTTADITVLDGTSRVNEIARMLGGDPESKVSRAHAKELLSSATA
ncbi:MAG TPA: DNA repair protein RecN [Gemmatimonadaceae bacterium]|jgi:DNA repair protein RecN (Recombination protein N)|nr:DNA repair protein RecN [Gemmatimonadaceae bacterium]